MAKTIRKAVIPAAGLGTRMLPASKVIPKEMLPVVDKPVIQYVLEEAASAKIKEVLLVLSRDKRAVEDHFNEDPELSARLREAGREQALASIAALASQVKIHSVLQPIQRGLGDAVWQARHHCADQPFLCLLGDTIFSGESPARQLVQAYEELGTSVIGLEEVPPQRVSRYGIVGGQMLKPGVMRVQTLIEKPAAASAPSRLAIAARYLLTPAIFDCIEQTSPGKAGEIQLTDALRLLLEREPIHGIILRGQRHDIGNPIDWLRANLSFASRDQAAWSELAPLIKDLAQREA